MPRIHHLACWLTDFCDGALFKKNSLCDINLLLYQDSFEVANPIGSAKNIHKLLAVYYILGNSRAFLRSKVEQIQLVMLINEKNFKRFGQETSFHKLVEDLRSLEDGHIVNGKTIRAGVFCFLGDNLGSHTIGGLTENFSTSIYFCRYCLITLCGAHSDLSRPE